jgi:hypothetical protein
VARAFVRIGDLIEANAPCLVTIPCGYNDYLDELIRQEQLPQRSRRFSNGSMSTTGGSNAIAWKR